MSVEWVIYIGTWIAVFLSLIRWVPVSKLPDACVIFLFMQFITWGGGLFVVEMGWIEYPFRMLEKNQTSVLFEYVAFPVLSIFFNLYYPKSRRKAVQLRHYLWFGLGITLLEYILEKYTRLITYTGWTWYWTLLTVMTGFYISHKYYWWYRNREPMRNPR